MTFLEEKTDEFIQFFNRNKSRIGSFEGVQKLHLLQGTQSSNIFFTYSYWESEDTLEKYRKSDLFKSIWKETKAMFSEPAEAWSTEIIDKY